MGLGLSLEVLGLKAEFAANARSGSDMPTRRIVESSIFLAKPYNISELAEVLQRAMLGKKEPEVTPRLTKFIKSW